MSMAAIRWAFEQIARAGAKLVLLCLAWHSDRDGRNAFPGVKTISAETGLDERTVRRHLDALEEVDLVDRHRRHVESGPRKGERLPDSFSLRLPSRLPGDLSGCDDAQDDETTGHFDGDNRVILQRQPGVLSPVYRRNPVSEPSKRTQNHIDPDLSLGEMKNLSSNKTARKKKTPDRRSPMPTNWPDQVLQAEAIAFWQSKHRHDLAEAVDHHAAQARDHHLAKGSRFADWSAAWRTWYRNAVEFNRERAVASTRGNSSAFVDVAQELLEEFDAE